MRWDRQGFGKVLDVNSTKIRRSDNRGSAGRLPLIERLPPAGMAVPERSPDGPEVSRCPTSRLVVVDEVDGYASALSGVHIEAVRTGLGSGPNAVSTLEMNDVAMFACSVGFPVVGRTTIADDFVVVALITSAPPGSRWSGVDLVPGTVLLYGPGSDHTGISHSGLECSFALVACRDIEKTADQLQRRVELPESGVVAELEGPLPDGLLVKTLSKFSIGLESEYSDSSAASNVLTALVGLLSDDDQVSGGTGRRHVDSRKIVFTCIDHVETIGSIPSIPELSTVAHTSERRLRYAFADTFDLSPGEFFRLRRLNLARALLAADDSEISSVTEVAVELGIGHLGRFAERYADIWGECPSETLRTHPSRQL